MLSFAKLQENHDKKLEHEQIDEILSIVNNATELKINELNKEYNELTEEMFVHPSDIDSYRDMLYENMVEIENLKMIAEEIAIMSLYKNMEVKISNIVERLAPHNLKRNFTQTLNSIVTNLKEIDGYDSYNELRLINNAIKHEGRVTDELTKNYPHWIKEKELKNMREAYDRLLPGAKVFLRNIAMHIYTIKQKN
ncbi:hypothetical protein [Klebsiella variicola]|uniref:hypothetical protein n=1 Tax=Klebsiella variicola TaxID=244366 RepID=UPI003755158B